MNPPLRIVHCIDYFQPKLGYQETFLAKEHARAGHEVFVVTSDRYNPYVYEGDAARKVLGNRVFGSGFFNEEGIKVWRLKTLFELKRKVWPLGLEKKILELKPDILIMHGTVNFFTLRVARLKKKIKNFKLINDDHMVFYASRSKVRFLYPFFKFLFSRLLQDSVDAFVGVSQTSKMFMCDRYGIPLERITVISLGADDHLFKYDGAARSSIRNRLSINEKDIVFIYAGKIVIEKGPHLLANAIVEITKHRDNIKVMLVGNGLASYMDEMKQDIKKKNLENRFMWVDAVPNNELYKYYSSADVAVWPREASLGMIEAMSCGLPIIISDTSEVTERVGRGNGLTYKGDDTSDLAKQMEKLLEPELRKRMGEQGKRFVKEDLSWSNIARQFIEVVK